MQGPANNNKKKKLARSPILSGGEEVDDKGIGERRVGEEKSDENEERCVVWWINR